MAPQEQPGEQPWIKDVREGERVRGRYLVKGKKAGITRAGKPYLSLVLADRSGELEAKLWEGVERISPLLREGDIAEVSGMAQPYQGHLQVVLTEIQRSGDLSDRERFLESAPEDASSMLRDLRELLGGLKNRHLRTLVDRFFLDGDFVFALKTAPAAKNFHHNYLGGLLEHTLSVCRLAGRIAEHYPNLDGDLLLAGAFLHDLGKIRELSLGPVLDYTDEGRLLGHVVLGVALLEEKIKLVKAFPEDLSLRLKHILLSHHGEFAFGSPKRPKFLEAYALHLLDDLDAKMNGIRRFQERDRQEGHWTEFNRMFDRYFLKGSPSVGVGAVPDIPEDQERGPQQTLF